MNKDLLEKELLKEAKDNGFTTREEFVKWKLKKDLSCIKLHYIDITYNRK